MHNNRKKLSIKNKIKNVKKMMKNYIYYRQYVVFDDKKIYYLRICKAANSSIKASMYNSYVVDDYSIHEKISKYTIVTRSFLDKKDYFGFTYVRNPFSRLVSCYESKYHADIEKNKYFFDSLKKHLFGFMKNDKGFNNFLFKVIIIPNAISDRHFTKQYNEIYRKGKCSVDFVGKVEEMDTYKAIAEKYGFAPIKHYNTSYKVDYRDYYSTVSAFFTYLKYRKDVKYFNYKKEYKELLNYTIKNKRIFKNNLDN